MRLSLLLLGAPQSSQSGGTALRFARAALQAGHQIYRVFLYHDAVLTGNSLTTPPQDETDLPVEWQQLAAQHNIDLVVCVSSALKRGILDIEEAKRYEKSAANLHTGFEISGLGQLVDASFGSDRLITFGP